MLMNQPWMKGLNDLAVEKIQAQEEGKDLSLVMDTLDELAARANDPLLYARADQLYDQIQAIPVRPDFPYKEPDALPEIHALQVEKPALSLGDMDDDELYDRILGAWQARCAGCLLGQPVEGWHRARIQGLLRDTDNWPVRRYISSDIAPALREKYDVTDEHGPYGSKLKNWINNVAFMPEDDDTSYTIFALKLVETRGRDFTSEDVAEEWLSSLPLLRTCTAERVAYMNLSNLILPPKSATTHNPFREWIGAQIRGDFFGYINPGDPAAAADMAYRDAAISHVKNGIYGEMYAAAMIAAAFADGCPETIVRAGLSQIPHTSRLYAQADALLQAWKRGVTLETFLEGFYQRYDERNGHDWCHTIPNALLVTAGVLYHQMDFVSSIAFGVTAGFDTDCNAATIGSIIGAAKGSKALPTEWIAPMNNTVRSCVTSNGELSMTDFARRTLALTVR